MDGKSSPTKFCIVLTFLLYVSAFQLMANEEVKSTELNVLQLSLSKDFDAEELIQVVPTRDGPFYFSRPRKLGFCLYTRCCKTDDDCIGAKCGPNCHPNVYPCNLGSSPGYCNA